MAGPHLYRSDDAGAPVHYSVSGSWINVMKKCLVDGYGSQPGAGWTVALDDPGSNRTIFRNDFATGSGRYWLVKDDGILKTTNATGDNHAGACSIKGCASFTNIDTTAGDFPRCVTGTDLHFATDYGIHPTWWSPMYSGGSWSNFPNPATPINWVVIADEATAWFLTFPTNHPGVSTFPTVSAFNLTFIGDVEPLNPSAGLPRAMTIGASVSTGSDFGVPAVTDNSLGSKFIELSIGGGSESVKSVLITQFGIRNLDGYQSSSDPDSLEFVPYPDPTMGGLSLIDLLIAEDHTDARRVGPACNHDEFLVFAKLRGIYGCRHAVKGKGVDTYKMGNSGDFIEVGGRSYLIAGPQVTSATDNSRDFILLFDVTGPWA